MIVSCPKILYILESAGGESPLPVQNKNHKIPHFEIIVSKSNNTRLPHPRIPDYVQYYLMYIRLGV